MVDLAIAYRIYPGVSKTPAFFPTDKLKLSAMCLRSFKEALGGLKIKIWALLDGCPPVYEDLFRSTFAAHELEILTLPKVGNLPTFSLQIDTLTKQNDADYVYFAEDDYFYLPGALEKLLVFMQKNTDVDFATPYDHPDSYFTSSRFERHTVRPFGDQYWRTASSTCLTFMTRKATLIRTQSMLRTYSRGNWDCPMWLSLTQKTELANLRVHWNNLFRMAIWAKTIGWGLGRLLLGRRYRLWVPIPALATHMEAPCVSPIVNWQEIFTHHTRLMSDSEDQVPLPK